MKHIYSTILVLATLLLPACSVKENLEAENPSDGLKVFSVSLEGNNDTRTTLDFKTVKWSQGDAIAVFAPDGTMAKFTIRNSSINGSSALFEGSIKDAAEYHAVYPYSAATSFDGTYLNFTVPTSQTATLDGFGNGANISVATSKGTSLMFKNVGTLLKVNVKYSNVRSIEFTSTGPSVAGSFKIKPDCTSIAKVSGTNKVTLTASANLTPGVYYAFVPYSGTSVTNLDVTFKTSSATIKTVSFAKGFKYQRNRICNLGDFGVGISSVQDLLNFASAVNNGTSTAEWEGSDGSILLLRDLDLSGVTEWTPIGYATVNQLKSSSPITVSAGHAFTGTFDGNGHTIKGLKMTAPSGLTVIKPYGFFGVVGEGGLIQNFRFDANSQLTVNSNYGTVAGIAAGLIYGASVRDITSYAKISFTPSGNVAVYCGLVGGAWGSATTGFLIDSCHSNGTITAKHSGTASASFASYTVGGLLGMAEAATSTGTPVSSISDSSNEGAITSTIYRTGGCVGTLSKQTNLTNVNNNGAITISAPAGAQVGGITALVSSYCNMTNCQNAGNITCTNKAYAGGLMANVAAGGRSFTGCSNYGIILTDSDYRGVLFGYTGTTTARIHKYTNCTAAGKLGKYNGGSTILDSYTEAEQQKYLGYDSGKETLTLTNITYKIGTTDPSQGGEAKYRILFIGNSFSQDACHQLGGVITGAGIKDILVVQMYYGGRTIPEYNSKWTANDYTKHTIAPGSANVVNTSNQQLSTVVASEAWDCVCIQEHTGTYFAWIWTDAEKTAIQELVNKVLATQSKTPKLYYLVSQAYYDFGKVRADSKPYCPGGAQELFKDRQGMHKVICDQAKNVMKEIAFDGVVSTGTALENLRTTSLMKTHSLGLTRDGYHMDYGIARYCAACACYQVLIYPKYKKELSANTYRNSESSTTTGAIRTPITDANVPIAQKAAIEAVNNPYVITDLSAY